MKVNEDLSILFWLKRQKAIKEGLVPIYICITVKGGRTEFSSGKKIHTDHRDEKYPTATSGCTDYKLINSYIIKTKAEL
ncbi:Arm DNA-binding domain-containing protein [Mucilaginibacter phyllosphaerae]